jgi:hypothetical protein
LAVAALPHLLVETVIDLMVETGLIQSLTPLLQRAAAVERLIGLRLILMVRQGAVAAAVRRQILGQHLLVVLVHPGKAMLVEMVAPGLVVLITLAAAAARVR